MGSKDIICTLHKKYDDDRRKLYELKKGNAKVDIVLNSLCMLIYGKKRAKKAIIENTKARDNIKDYIAIIENKCVIIFRIDQYLYDVLNDIDIKLKSENYYDVLDAYSEITRYIIKSLNSMHANSANNKNTSAND